MKFNAFVFRKLTGHQHRIKSIEAKSLKHVYLRINKSSYFLNFFCSTFSPYHNSANHNLVAEKNCRWSRIHIFFTKIFLEYWQPVERSLKHTIPRISPSSTVGWVVVNQPGQLVPHLNACTRSVGILVPAAPTKRYHPLRSWLSHSASLGSVCVSIGFTQVWVMMARISYKEKWYF